jgi:site-specific DNA recombinase
MKQRIPGYARVSSREQAQNSHALEQQIARLRAAGATEIYFDVESRSKDEREDLNKILYLIETRQCDEAVFIRIDRLTDSSVLLERVIRICLDSDIRIRGLDDSIDLHTVGGRLHARILVNVARGEVERLAERVKHGWEYLRKRKVAMNPPFGYVKVDDRHELDHRAFLCLLESQEERSRAAIAREIVETFLSQKSLRLALRCINQKYGISIFAHNQGSHQKGGRVAQGMFRFSVGGLRNWLTNPVLQGHLSYLRGGEYQGRAEIHPNTHPDHRLITDEEAQQIEAVLSHNKQVRGFGSTALKYPLSGLVFCGECRSACYSLTGQNNYHRAKRLGIAPEMNYYFQCKNWKLRACQQKTLIRMEVAEAAVIDTLIQRAEAIALLAEQPVDAVDPPELQALKAELAYYQQAPGNRADGIVTDLRRQIEEFRYRQTTVGQQELANRELLLQVFGDRLYWKTLSDAEKQHIYRALVERVVMKDGQVVSVVLKV